MVVYCWCRHHLHPPLHHYYLLHLPHLESQSRQLDWHILPQCYWLWRHLPQFDSAPRYHIVNFVIFAFIFFLGMIIICSSHRYWPDYQQCCRYLSSHYNSCCASYFASAHELCDRSNSHLLSSVGIFHSLWLPLPFSILSSVKTRRFFLLYLRLLWSLSLLLSLRYSL